MKDCETNLRERILQCVERIKLDSKMFASMALTSLKSGESSETNLQGAVSLYASIVQAKALIEVYNESVDDPEMKDVEINLVSEHELCREYLYDYLKNLKRAINRI